MQIFVLGAAVMGIAGAMLTTLDGQFMPGSYQPLRFTFPIWVMVIVGGPRHAQNIILKRDSPGLSGISGILRDRRRPSSMTTAGTAGGSRPGNRRPLSLPSPAAPRSLLHCVARIRALQNDRRMAPHLRPKTSGPHDETGARVRLRRRRSPTPHPGPLHAEGQKGGSVGQSRLSASRRLSSASRAQRASNTSCAVLASNTSGAPSAAGDSDAGSGGVT